MDGIGTGVAVLPFGSYSLSLLLLPLGSSYYLFGVFCDAADLVGAVVGPLAGADFPSGSYFG